MASAVLLTWLLIAQANKPIADDPPKPAPVTTDTFAADPAWKPLGKDLWFDPQGRQVVVRTRVVQDDVPLEFFLCTKGAKDHETILTTEAAPKLIQAALILTGAESGHPVRFEPKFEPPAGTPIAIRAEWERDGQKKQADARQWIKESRSGLVLQQDWVFAGSVTYEDRRTKRPVFAADDGTLFTVANFASAILDLPYRSTDANADLSYVAHKDQIPPIGTSVTLYLAPRKPAAAGPSQP